MKSLFAFSGIRANIVGQSCAVKLICTAVKQSISGKGLYEKLSVLRRRDSGPGSQVPLVR